MNPYVLFYLLAPASYVTQAIFLPAYHYEAGGRVESPKGKVEIQQVIFLAVHSLGQAVGGFEGDMALSGEACEWVGGED